MINLGGEVLLDQLEAPARRWLAELGQRRSYGNGELIHSRGDPEPKMGIVIKGMVRLVRIEADGQHTFVSTLRPGQHYGDVVMFGRRQRSHDAVADGEVEIDHYDQAAFARILDRADVVGALYRITAIRLTGSMTMSDDLRSLSRSVHLAKILLYLWRNTGMQRTIDCTQQDLAALLGTSVMSLSKYLAQLKEAGLIETAYRQVLINDPDQLKAWLRQRQQG